MVQLLKRTNPIDVVWCFDFNTFSDLRIFGAQTNIYHPVDPVSAGSHVEVGRTADIILSVSKEILESFASLPVPRFVIDHGLAPPFARHAANPPSGVRRAGPLRVGYAGNLARPPLNRPVVTRMVAGNPDAEFHFWGPSKVLDYVPDEFRREVQTFMDFLAAAPNVTLHGSVSSERLAEEFQQMDCFIMSYRRHPTESDLSNSHKILEYFSTGKVVVSTPIARYAHLGDLVVSGTTDDDSDLPDILLQTLARLDEVNSESRMTARRELALENTYARQVDRIRDIVLALPARRL
jgi:glycosyltransferase involved in cell wall biosynthesis